MQTRNIKTALKITSRKTQYLLRGDLEKYKNGFKNYTYSENNFYCKYKKKKKRIKGKKSKKKAKRSGM